MRTIFLLRGAPGSGKSTWVKNNNLEPYTLCADNIRTMMQSPVMTISGDYVISQKNDSEVWKLLFSFLENRMDRGEFIVVDATHYKRELLNRYCNLLDKYRYRAFVVDFTKTVTKDECIKRNEQREGYKKVPIEVIEKQYAVFENESNKQLKTRFIELTPDEAIDKINTKPIIDLSHYHKVVIFGDVHGCYEPIKSWFDKNPYSENTMYIFCGDYIDRGLQNNEVLDFIIEFSKKKNVLCLEGNHERWLRYFSSKDPKDLELIKSREFKEKTVPQIESFNKTEIRQFCRKLGQMAYFTFQNYTILVTHGGLSNLPTILTSTEEMVKGVGKYEDIDEVREAFLKNINYNPYIKQIHGHRNVRLSDIVDDENSVYNLCDEVEYGEPLRIVEICRGGLNVPEIYTHKIDNPIHAERPITKREIFNLSKNEIVDTLNHNRMIIKKELPDGIISYSFSRDVFNKKEWNSVTTTARGLFCRGDDIVARSYNKFFNFEERRETSIRELKRNLQFPVDVYLKENGFLGLLTYDNDKLLFTSKSTTQGEYVGYFKKIFEETLSEESKQKITDWLKTTGASYTLIFEVIDPKNDPHIVEYEEPKIVLLDAVNNSFEPEFGTYEFIKTLGKDWNIPYKEKMYTIENFDDLMDCVYDMEHDKDAFFEGVVCRDITGFQFKVKTAWYNKWKYFRTLKDKYCRGNLVQVFKNKDEVNFVNWLKSQDVEKLNNMSIIDVRNEYLKY